MFLLWLRNWTGSFVSNCSCVRSVRRNRKVTSAVWPPPVSFHLYSSSIIPPPPHMKSYFEIIKSRNVTMATRQAWFLRTASKQKISAASRSLFFFLSLSLNSSINSEAGGGGGDQCEWIWKLKLINHISRLKKKRWMRAARYMFYIMCHEHLWSNCISQKFGIFKRQSQIN